MMFLSVSQVERSIDRLSWLNPFFGMSLLAFKRANIPVGNTITVSLSAIVGQVLDQHYKPAQAYEGYYTPLFTSNPQNRWLSRRYGSTALQRITADTFADVLLHTKNSSEWGWHPNYIDRLEEHLREQRIPAWDLAVWLYRDKSWVDNFTPDTVIQHFLDANNITDEEVDTLFDVSVPELLPNWSTGQPFSEAELLQVIGYPPGVTPEGGAALRLLELNHVGPGTRFSYQPADRLNIITGDNSLGKTFLLDAVWWSLTDTWLDYPAQPKRDIPKNQPYIKYAISTSGRSQEVLLRYDWDRLDWRAVKKREVLPGLVIYARHDGSFALWDPIRTDLLESSGVTTPVEFIALNREDVWNGLEVDSGHGRSIVVSNGLLRDWVRWQMGGERYEEIFTKFSSCLSILSPAVGAPLWPGEPTRLPHDAREIPTLQMPYGEVPIIHASAGVQRVVALAYLLVWAWFEHREAAEVLRRVSQRRLVLIVDEVEAHLHPRWQRTIIPSIMAVIEELTPTLSAQIHLATHSPMVLASVETVFDEKLDDLHHLRQDGRAVVLEELPFVKHGRADAWLTSDVFGLNAARSVPAEEAIEAAKKLQLSVDPSNEAVGAVNLQLERSLAPDDTFWARWRFFAKQHGVGL